MNGTDFWSSSFLRPTQFWLIPPQLSGCRCRPAIPRINLLPTIQSETIDPLALVSWFKSLAEPVRRYEERYHVDARFHCRLGPTYVSNRSSCRGLHFSYLHRLLLYTSSHFLPPLLYQSTETVQLLCFSSLRHLPVRGLLPLLRPAIPANC